MTIQDLKIANGFTDDTGGGIYMSECTVTLINTTVSGNNSQLGGGILNVEGSLTLLNSNHKIQAVPVDNGEPGVSADQFSLTVWAPNGALVNELNFRPELLVEGNIQVPHKPRRK